jgi:cellulose synthase/poly-beta-1,6-N-acetylglucosamine synthase-like glycosyltransferase/peptidoglycan/xylan/chitin deacetylase (PgdA/CDA1 family)
VGRHERSRPRQRSRQVFASKSGHRGLIVLVFLMVLAVDLVLAVTRAGQLAAAAPLPSPLHADAAYPRLLADEMAACGRVHGELAGDGKRGIPIVGSGVFQRVVQVRRSGRTAFAVDPFSGRVVMGRLTPIEIHNTQGCDYAIEQFGEVPPRTLLLTFDDGPNPVWTPKVLAVLKAYGARATFFAIGENILRAPAAFRLVIASGNVVGNHTFSHPVLEDLAPAAARSQLVTTSHIIAAVGGYQTQLFRTPYGANYGPVQAGANVYATLVAQQLGFTQVGFTVDSSDYEYSPSSEIPLPAFGGAGLPGQAIVMHDTWGKDDAATVRLLERILQKAEALGYRFMTVDQLLQQQGESNPVGQIQPTLGDRLGYWATWARQVLPQTGLPLVLTVATWVVLGFGIIWIMRALYGGWKQRRPVPSWHPKLVSVLIAAKDEKAVIRATIESIFAHRYPFGLQVVVVNDGSMDGADGTADGPGGTKAILDELSARYCHESRKLEVIHLDKNVGKAAALDLAFRTRIRGEVCAAFDADTRLGGPDTIPNLVRHFRDPKVGAVAGYIRAGNVTRHPWKWVLFRFQQAEYNLGIGLMRVAQGKNGILIVPGACSAWRTSAMRKIGVPGDTVGEDADAGLELREAGFTVVQDIKAVAITQAPDTLKGIAKQWTRWTFGTVQNLWKHKKIMARVGEYGALTWVMWYSVLGLLIPIVLMPLNYFITVTAIASGNWSKLVIYLVVFTGFRLLQNLTAMVVLREWSWDPLTAVFYRFINDPLQVYLAYRTVFAIATGRLISWKGTRVARIQAADESSQLRAA